MKKIFTLISMALVAMSVNAQTESYSAIGEDAGSLATEFQNAAQNESGDKIVTIQGTHTTIVGVSSATPTEIESDKEGLSWTNLTWPAENWGEATWSEANKNKNIWHYDTDGTTQIHDFQFRSVWGKGNPVTGFVSEPVMTEGIFAGKYRANYDGFYFDPETSTSVPAKGEYFTFTSDVAGMFKVGFYVANGNNRYMYIVEKSTVRTLDINEYKVEGYVNGVDNEDGSPMWQASIKVNADRSIGNTEGTTWKDGEQKTVNELNQPKYGWFVFDAKAGETYYIFTPNTQFGFRSMEFTPGASINDYTPTNPTGIEAITTKGTKFNANAPMYNLSGQKVDKSYKGVVIQNGRKIFNK